VSVIRNLNQFAAADRFGTATNLAEGQVAAQAGIDAVVAQGYEAGGHRGVFDPFAPDDRLGTVALTRLLVRKLDVPVIAAGGIMDGAGIAASLTLGAAAAQLGTAFIANPESSADAGYRAALLGPPAEHTVMTAVLSGRPARCLANRYSALGMGVEREAIPDYPIAYDAAKKLHAAAKAGGSTGTGPSGPDRALRWPARLPRPNWSPAFEVKWKA
jgi:nitronate monooxygenase